MSDYVTRLEAELIRAAEREQRRGPRPLPRRLRTAPRGRALIAAALAVSVVAIALVGLPRHPRPTPPAGPVPARLAGDYETTVAGGGRVALILDTRRYTLLLPGADTVVGDAALQGTTLLLGNDGLGACRPTAGVALYRVSLLGSDLRLTRISDACPARTRALDAVTLHRSG